MKRSILQKQNLVFVEFDVRLAGEEDEHTNLDAMAIQPRIDSSANSPPNKDMAGRLFSRLTIDGF